MFNKYSLICVLSLITASCSDGDVEINEPQEAEILDTDFYQEKEVETIIYNSDNAINIVFMGDGYTKGELGVNHGTYRSDMLKHIDYLFTKPPFSEYQEYFNVSIIYAESQKAGPSYIDRDTAFSTLISRPGNRIESWDYAKLNEYTDIAVPDELFPNVVKISMLAIKDDNDVVGGLGCCGFGIFSSVRPDIMLHEFGHGFSDLGDEYVRSSNPVPANTEYTANLDTTSSIGEVKWSHFIGLEGYEDVGVFEGGGYVPEGIWRPEENSIMRATTMELNFNAPSREALVKRILELTGNEYTFQAFLEKDVVVNVPKVLPKEVLPLRCSNFSILAEDYSL